MSFPNYVDYLVRQEQHKDLLREANQQRMVKGLKPRPGRYRAVGKWIGGKVQRAASLIVLYLI